MSLHLSHQLQEPPFYVQNNLQTDRRVRPSLYPSEQLERGSQNFIFKRNKDDKQVSEREEKRIVNKGKEKEITFRATVFCMLLDQ